MKIIECPRDAMQGISSFIPSDLKIAYINQLLKVGFDTIDFGSFVSPKAIPQMADSGKVLSKLDISQSSSKLLAIVANIRGAREASALDEITYLGFPLSISETFQEKNTNKTIAQALNELNEIQNICLSMDKQLVCYISMGFGNPYGDPYDAEIVAQFAGVLATMGVRFISLSDTIGVSEKDNITYLFKNLICEHPKIEFGAHMHANPQQAMEKIRVAYEAGCRRFDGAIKGYGGCPMATDKLTGNIATEEIIAYLESKGHDLRLNMTAFQEAIKKASAIFDHYK